MTTTATDTTTTPSGAMPMLDQLLADWGSLTVEHSGRTILLPAHPNADTVVFTIVLPLHLIAPEAVAPARLWAASLPLCRVGSVTLHERIAELGGELTARIAAGAALLAGSCPHASLSRSVDAIRGALHGPGRAPAQIGRASCRERV